MPEVDFMITEIKKQLEALHYVVYTQPQEKQLGKKELLLRLAVISFGPDYVTGLYDMPVGIDIEFQEPEPAAVVTTIVDIVKNLEPAVKAGTDPDKLMFKFDRITITPLGQYYRVIIGCQYTEVIDIV